MIPQVTNLGWAQLDRFFLFLSPGLNLCIYGQLLLSWELAHLGYLSWDGSSQLYVVPHPLKGLSELLVILAG